MKKLFLLALILTLPLLAEEKICSNHTSQNQEELNNIEVSEALGYVVGRTLEMTGFKLDPEAFSKGIKEFSSGRKTPLNREECVKVLASFVEKSLQELSVKNLKKAEEFLAANSQNKDVIELEKGKLQYKVVQKGGGPEVKPYFSPLVQYTSKDLDGFVFSNSSKEVVDLGAVIPGLSKGLIGMKEGEKRTIYIHPDLGYGTKEAVLPNLLLIFDVEIIKANYAAENVAPDPMQEIALPKTYR